MLTPHRSMATAPNSSDTTESPNIVLTMNVSGKPLVVTHDGFSIGSSGNCDAVLDDSGVPALHSVIHMQSGAIWIEVVSDDFFLIFNDRHHRRLALRHEDRVRIGSSEITFIMKQEISTPTQDAPLSEDLSLLNAEELCDRILSEQALIDEFVEGQRSGWEALLKAIESAHEDASTNSSSSTPANESQTERVAFNQLLEEIQELNETVKGHTRELDDYEQEVMKTTSLMEESQHRAVQQLNDLLEKLKSSDPPNELRASA
jgi:hypothetical protein